MDEKEPAVRAICTSPFHKGSRWLLRVYFYRANKHSRSGLQSWCKTCVKIKMRKGNLAEIQVTKRNEYSRLVKERERREQGVPIRQLYNPRFDPRRFAAFCDRFTVLRQNEQGAQPTAYLNGRRLGPDDMQYINKCRNGKMVRVSLDKADYFATYYDLPMWELEQVATRYKEDIRTQRRKRKKKETSLSG